MNWLHDISRAIRRSDAPYLQKDKLVLTLITLSSICDKYVPQAPAPEFEEVDGDLCLSWARVMKERNLTIFAPAHAGPFLPPMMLSMYDSGREQDIDQPSYDQLKTAVCSLFDGWEPR